MIDPVLVKYDMLRYVQEVRQGKEWNEISYSHITMLYTVKSSWILYGLKGER